MVKPNPWTQQAPQIASEGLVPSSKAAPQTTAAISAAMSTLELWDDGKGKINGGVLHEMDVKEQIQKDLPKLCVKFCAF